MEPLKYGLELGVIHTCDDCHAGHVFHKTQVVTDTFNVQITLKIIVVNLFRQVNTGIRQSNFRKRYCHWSQKEEQATSRILVQFS